MFEWLRENEALILSSLLGLSEVLALFFPSESGFGGILAGAIKVLKKLKDKPEIEKK
jgi:hypothetical protein